VTFQLLAVAPVPVYFGDFAITDLTAGRIQYGVQEDSYPVPTRQHLRAAHRRLDDERRVRQDTLHAALPGYTLDLQLQTTKQAALHGANGVIRSGPWARRTTTPGRPAVLRDDR